jgi:hypothetical protein
MHIGEIVPLLSLGSVVRFNDRLPFPKGNVYQSKIDQ